MNVVMPPLLQSAQLKPDVTITSADSDDDIDEDDERFPFSLALNYSIGFLFIYLLFEIISIEFPLLYHLAWFVLFYFIFINILKTAFLLFTCLHFIHLGWR